MFLPPPRKKITLDITVPEAYFQRNKEQKYRVNLIHWSNYRTKLALYRFEVEKMTLLQNGRIDSIEYKILYQFGLRYYILTLLNTKAYVERVIGKVKKILSR